MKVRLIEVLTTLVFVFALGAYFAPTHYLARDRFSLLGCSADEHVCRVFDTWQGRVELTPLPQTPAEQGKREL